MSYDVQATNREAEGISMSRDLRDVRIVNDRRLMLNGMAQWNLQASETHVNISVLLFNTFLALAMPN
jgi:hypothetical protein